MRHSDHPVCRILFISYYLLSKYNLRSSIFHTIRDLVSLTISYSGAPVAQKSVQSTFICLPPFVRR